MKRAIDDPLLAATSETTPRIIWGELVAVAAIARGVDPEWIRTPAVRARMSAAYNAGEPAWMVVDELLLRWGGVKRAEREDADSPAALQRFRRKKRDD